MVKPWDDKTRTPGDALFKGLSRGLINNTFKLHLSVISIRLKLLTEPLNLLGRCLVVGRDFAAIFLYIQLSVPVFPKIIIKYLQLPAPGLHVGEFDALGHRKNTMKRFPPPKDIFQYYQ